MTLTLITASYAWSPSSIPHPPENMENQYSSSLLEGISNVTLIAHHCTHLSRTLRTSLENFQQKMDRTHQLLQVLSQQPSAPNQLLATLQVELTNINDVYISYKPTIIPAINLLNTDPSFDGHSTHNNHARRSLLPFLGNALSWLTGMQLQKISITSRKESINSLKHSLHNRKLWFTLYPSLMSDDMQHKWTGIVSMPWWIK